MLAKHSLLDTYPRAHARTYTHARTHTHVYIFFLTGIKFEAFVQKRKYMYRSSTVRVIAKK